MPADDAPAGSKLPPGAPRTWVFVDAFPLTGSRKVKKFELREQYLKGELTPSQ